MRGGYLPIRSPGRRNRGRPTYLSRYPAGALRGVATDHPQDVIKQSAEISSRGHITASRARRATIGPPRCAMSPSISLCPFAPLPALPRESARGRRRSQAATCGSRSVSNDLDRSMSVTLGDRPTYLFRAPDHHPLTHLPTYPKHPREQEQTPSPGGVPNPEEAAHARPRASPPSEPTRPAAQR